MTNNNNSGSARRDHEIVFVAPATVILLVICLLLLYTFYGYHVHLLPHTTQHILNCNLCCDFWHGMNRLN